MTMLDVPVVYTVETNDCESILTEHHRALEAPPMPYTGIGAARCI
jgi:hypothetical protein